MRYARQEDLQKLALTMQGSAEGISLADIERQFKVSRRTAERMRDAVRNAYPQIEEISGERGRKYWRFPPGSLGRMVEPTLDELTAGHRAAAIARREGDEVTADTLERLLTKVQAMFREDRRRTIAADLEAQLMADGVAFRPGPRENNSSEILSALREAILAGVMISARKDDGTTKPQSPSRLETLLVSPLAWLLDEVGGGDMSWSAEELDVMAKGNIAHDVFEHVFLKDQPGGG